MIRRRHRQGIFSSTEIGVCPNSARNFFDGFFLRLRTSPRSITTSCSYVTPSIRITPKENFWNCILGPPILHAKHFTFGFPQRSHFTVCGVPPTAPRISIARLWYPRDQKSQPPG